jgi:hypothetical protein
MDGSHAEGKVKPMSVLGLSIILMAVVAGSALVSALIAESAAGAPTSRRFDGAGMVPAAPAEALRCRPKLLPKCPHGQKRVCLATKGSCCVKFGCQPQTR